MSVHQYCVFSCLFKKIQWIISYNGGCILGVKEVKKTC